MERRLEVPKAEEVNKTAHDKLLNDFRSKRLTYIWARLEDKATFEEIADELGVSYQSIQQLVKRWL